MKNFTVIFFFFCTFASLGALAHGQWHNGGILGHLLGFAGQRIQGFSGGRTSGNECISTESVSCISYHEDVCQEVNGRTQCEAIPKCQCVGRQKWTVRWEIWMCMCINMNVMIIITPPHAVHVLSQNKKGEVCGFSSLNAVLGLSSSSKEAEFNHDWNYNYPSLEIQSTVLSWTLHKYCIPEKDFSH